mgnify:CR=1 FL=1
MPEGWGGGGSGGGGGGGPDWRRPGAPTPKPPVDQNMADFLAALKWSQKGLKGDIGNLSGLYGQFGDIALGNDPLLARLKAEGIDTQRGNLARQGITGSVAENEFVRTAQGFDAMNLGRRDMALGSQAGIVGQMSDTRSAYAQNAALPKGLDIAELAAKNQGKGDGGGGMFGTAICTVVWEKGDLPLYIYNADCEYANTVPYDVRVGYWTWAVPLSKLMRRSRIVYLLIRPIARAWAYDMYQRTRNGARGPRMGRWLSDWGEPICRYLGRAVMALRGLHEAS